MAKVHVLIGTISDRAQTGATLEVFDPILLTSETLTAGSSSTVSSISAPAVSGAAWEVLAIDGDVWVAFGESPNAAADPRFYVPAGRSLNAMAKAGHKVAVKTA